VFLLVLVFPCCGSLLLTVWWWFFVMWIAPFDSVVISLRAVLSNLAVEFRVAQRVGYGRSGSVRVLHCRSTS